MGGGGQILGRDALRAGGVVDEVLKTISNKRRKGGGQENGKESSILGVRQK